MQTIIHANPVLLADLQTALAGNPGLMAGYALLGIMALYGLALLGGTFRRFYFERGQRALAREALR